jgi:hypothetical protein
VVCAASAKSRGVPTPKEAGAAVLPDGRVTWEGASAKEIAKADVAVFAKVEAQEPKTSFVAPVEARVAAPAEPPAPTTEEVPTKRGRGRPKGSKNKPKDEAPAPQSEVFIEDNVIEGTETDEGMTFSGAILQGLTLIRGTPVKVPQGIPVVFLNEVLGRLADEIGKEAGTNFFAIGAFERKDRLAAAVSTWVMTLPAGTFIFAPRFQAGEFAYAVDVVAMNCRVSMEVTS